MAIVLHVGMYIYVYIYIYIYIYVLSSVYTTSKGCLWLFVHHVGVAWVFPKPIMADKVQLYTDSSAAKSFVSRTGLGRMKHLEIRDLWLQQEVGLGRVVVDKVDGTRNPADLMTKYLKRWEIEVRLRLMGIRIKWRQG